MVGRAPAAAAGRGGRLPRLSRSLDAADAEPGGREALVGALAIRSWVRELEAGLARMTGRLRAGLLNAAP